MKWFILIFTFFACSKLFAQYSSIIEFPVTTYEYLGSPIYNDQTGDSIAFNLKVYFSIPDNPVGIIYFFHGKGGGGLKWLLFVEQPILLMEAYNRGYGIVTMDSNNRIAKEWDVAMDSSGQEIGHFDTPDTENVWMVHQNLISLGHYSADHPVFTIGFSAGGIFASRMGLRSSHFFISNQDQLANVNNIVPFKALGINGATNPYSKSAQYDIPAILNIGINDNKFPPFPNMTWHSDWPYPDDVSVLWQYQNMLNNNIDVEFNLKPEETITPQTFIVIPGIDSIGSVAIYDTLKAITDENGQLFISEQDSLNFNPLMTSFWHAFIPPEFQNKLNLIEQQLEVVYAEHVVYRQYSEITIDFFDNYLMTTSAGNILETPSVKLDQNYPNPFSDHVIIPYTVSHSSRVQMLIYDQKGQQIETLIDKFQPPGNYSVAWKTKNESLSAGIYYCILKSEGTTAYRKMIYIP